MMKYSIGILVVCVAVICSEQTTCAADQAADKAAIEQAIESYTTAFNARDAKSLAAHWVIEAIYINPLTGSQVEGRALPPAHPKSTTRLSGCRSVCLP